LASFWTYDAHKYLNAPKNPATLGAYFGEERPPKKILITSARDCVEETRYVEVRTANGQYGHGMERRELNVPERA